MNKKQSLALRIFNGVPRFAGEVFCATKVPAILLFIGIGFPLVASLGLTVIAAIYRSDAPMQILRGGFIQFQSPEVQARLSPEARRFMHTLTHQQRALGRDIGALVMLDALLVLVAGFWWVRKFSRFVIRRWQGRSL
jgi:hypothetical protein